MSRTYEKSQARDEFDRWSRSYDRCILQRLLFGPAHRSILSVLAARFGDEPIRLLDVGCGTGVFASEVRRARPGASVVGVDLTRGMLEGGRERWRRHAGHVRPVQGDSERLPFASGAFDVVTCANSFHHYPHQDRAVGEMHRALRPGGVLILVDGYRDDPYGWFIYDLCVATVEGNVHHASRRRVRDLMRASGFAEVRQTVRYGLAPFLLTEAVAGAPSALAPESAEVVGASA